MHILFQDIIDCRVQVTPDELLLQPKLLQAIQRHPPLVMYINEFSQNTKRSMMKALKKIGVELQMHIPEDLQTNLKSALQCQMDYVLSHQTLPESLYNEVPSLRSIQISNEHSAR